MLPSLSSRGAIRRESLLWQDRHIPQEVNGYSCNKWGKFFAYAPALALVPSQEARQGPEMSSMQIKSMRWKGLQRSFLGRNSASINYKTLHLDRIALPT